MKKRTLSALLVGILLAFGSFFALPTASAGGGELDTDEDGLTDSDEENVHGTDPFNADTDGDGLDDFEEVNGVTDPLDDDSDDDGQNDGDEVNCPFGVADPNDPMSTCPVDTDNDGLSDDQEADLGTEPEDPDTDDDGLLDGDEINQYGTDPLDDDSDDDGLSDGDEVNTHGTNPNEADSDDDGDSDQAEIQCGSPALDPYDGCGQDSDGDGIDDSAEVILGTDSEDPDSDDDHIPDGREVKEWGTDPTLWDSDLDSQSDLHEITCVSESANPNDINSTCSSPDSDGDGLSDEWEFNNGSAPNNQDTDGDGVQDGDEFIAGTSPSDYDTDNDGDPDGVELECGSDPVDISVSCAGPAADADRDGLTDPQEAVYGTDPHDADTDNDGLVDGLELLGLSTNPTSPDSDGDGWTDLQELICWAPETAPAVDPGLGCIDFNDSDGDGLTDDLEGEESTDFEDEDSDDDGLNDGTEVYVTGSDPNDPDSDNDGFEDGVEFHLGWDPADPGSNPEGVDLTPGDNGSLTHKCKKVRGKTVCKISGVQITNIGPGPLKKKSAVVVSLFKAGDDPFVDAAWGKKTINTPIAPNGTLTVAVKVKKGAPPADVIIFIDLVDNFPEIDEDNNDGTFPLQV